MEHRLFDGTWLVPRGARRGSKKDAPLFIPTGGTESIFPNP